jgi:hypothetical protein
MEAKPRIRKAIYSTDTENVGEAESGVDEEKRKRRKEERRQKEAARSKDKSGGRQETFVGSSETPVVITLSAGTQMSAPDRSNSNEGSSSTFVEHYSDDVVASMEYWICGGCCKMNTLQRPASVAVN